MAFAVKATLVAFWGDVERYPCHAMLKIGDTVTFDGAEIKGRFCADTMTRIVDAMYKVFLAGPRYIDPSYYDNFWYAPLSTADPSKTAYDGNGWTPALDASEYPERKPGRLQSSDAHSWPPADRYPFMTETTVKCPDARTSAVFLIEAYDLASGGGRSNPFFRRQITIMDRIAKSEGRSWPIDKVQELYTDFELYEVYPPLVKELYVPGIRELEILGFAEIKDGIVTITEKGVQRVARFKDETTPDVIDALKL